ncbi:12441_t:CDS:2 [Acaulospora colombiana]|uniref:12441_t:CDS:1 n=1 Tax=Acaulospora colombiana TaxID=27376 RepID=A0ACA9KL94_9GLOM|nr:12441_t:CDS:2 [Acaulospora colombiana]
MSLREIISGDRIFPINPAPESSVKIGRNASLSILQAHIKEQPTFLDYISGGAEIQLSVAIDFTASNGNPHDPRSLHYINGFRQNDYQRAISSVGKILESYDSDKLFPVYGFGGKFNGNLSHAHPLNNNYRNPEVTGVDDMDSTIRAIIKASLLPLSIVIVGVGNADFTNMKILDADNEPLVQKLSPYSEPVKMKRDIVQFVAMRDFELRSSHYLLPKAVLEEIPDQFMSYMELHGKTPRPPIRRTTAELEKNKNLRTVNRGDAEDLEFDEPPPEYSA